MVRVALPWAARCFLPATTALLVLLALIVPGPALGDADLARFLLDGGKKALEKKQYDDAIVKLERARVEDATRIEIGYWLALAHDKKGNGPDAVREYRAFRDAARAAGATAPMDKETDALVKKADQRLAALAAGETELARLNAPFVDAMLAFAKAQYLRDPALALRAAEAVLAVSPAHAEAQRLAEKLRAEQAGSAAPAEAAEAPKTPAAGPSKPAGTYPDIKRWKDLVGTRAFGTSYDGWIYDAKGLTLDVKEGGSFYWPLAPVVTPARYVLEMEFSLKRADSPRWALGFGFAKDRQADHLSLFFSRSEVVPLHFRGGSPTNLQNPANISPIEVDTWHRFAVDVNGQNVKGWFDGKVVLDTKVASRDTLAGEVALYHQMNRVEIKSMRLGTKE